MHQKAFIARLGDDERLLFEETMALIDEHYHFTPTAFDNGGHHNDADQNQGSCKVFAFGQLNGLSEAQTLTCFGQYYRDVLATPDGEDHANIRNFMRTGWAGVIVAGTPLSPKPSLNIRTP